jgi:hypothetical protein
MGGTTAGHPGTPDPTGKPIPSQPPQPADEPAKPPKHEPSHKKVKEYQEKHGAE